MRTENESQRMLATLKRHLKSRGWTAAKIAHRLQIGEATAKRWLSGKALTIDRLTALANLCDLSLVELIRESENTPANLARELTLAQERALMADEFLALMFFTILSGYPPQETAADFELPQAMVENALAKLERLAVIWRKAPMRQLFETRMKAQFMAIDFAAPETAYASEVVKLSAQGAAALAELIEEYRRKVQALAKNDRETSHLPASWYTTLAVMRPLDLSGLERLRG
jgi:transcriptional regulator with XRE-family HTH domain